MERQLPITITVIAATPKMHVGDLDGAGVKLAKGSWKARVTIEVHDINGGLVTDATVTGTFAQDDGSTVDSLSCTTDRTGTCIIDWVRLPGNGAKATFTVEAMGLKDMVYNPSNDHDPDGDSNGTSIVVSK